LIGQAPSAQRLFKKMDEPRIGNNFFDDGSPYLSHPLLTPERTAAEVDKIATMVRSVSGRVLDVGCGFGRHSIEFASRGAEVTGIDPSPAMLSAARSGADAAGYSIEFQGIAADELADVGRYDLAVCLFTTLGQLDRPIADDAPHVEMLRRIRRALKPGGEVVIEVPDRIRVVAGLVADEMLGPTRVTRSFDHATSTIGEQFELGSGEIFNLTYRVFNQAELVDLVQGVGFKVRNVAGHGLVEPPDTVMTLTAVRPT